MSLTSDRLLSTAQVAEILTVSTDTVGRLCRSGELPSVKISGGYKTRRILLSDLEAYVRGLRTAQAETR